MEEEGGRDGGRERRGQEESKDGREKEGGVREGEGGREGTWERRMGKREGGTVLLSTNFDIEC